MSYVYMLDETGNDGNDPWLSGQPFYVHGLVKFSVNQSDSVYNLANRCRQDTGLDNLHMSEITPDERCEVIDYVSKFLTNIEWNYKETAIEKKFYPSSLFTDRILLNYYPDGRTRFKANTDAQTTVNLLAYYLFREEFRKEIWSAMKNKCSDSFEIATIKLYLELCKRKLSPFCKLLRDRIELFSKEPHVFPALVKGVQTNFDFQDFSGRTFINSIRLIESEASDSRPIVLQHRSSKLQSYFPTRAVRAHLNVPLMETVEYVYDNDKIFLIDVLVWISKTMHLRHRNGENLILTKLDRSIVSFIRRFGAKGSGTMNSNGFSEQLALRVLNSRRFNIYNTSQELLNLLTELQMIQQSRTNYINPYIL